MSAPDVHYLSATAKTVTDTRGVTSTMHMTFCQTLLTWGVDAGRYQVANYSDPTRVTCRLCLDGYAATYPESWAELLKRTPLGFTYERMETEDPRVHELRQAQASARRAQIEAWIGNPLISDVDFMFWLHKATYEDARELVQFALKTQNGEV